MELFIAFLVGCQGAVFGSFSGVVVERVPRGLSLGGRSVCVCEREIPMRHNVPVLGWLLLRGRAACCAAPIPGWYAAVEAWFFAVWFTAAVMPGRWPARVVVSLLLTFGPVAVLTLRKFLHLSR